MNRLYSLDTLKWYKRMSLVFLAVIGIGFLIVGELELPGLIGIYVGFHFFYWIPPLGSVFLIEQMIPKTKHSPKFYKFYSFGLLVFGLMAIGSGILNIILDDYHMAIGMVLFSSSPILASIKLLQKSRESMIPSSKGN